MHTARVLRLAKSPRAPQSPAACDRAGNRISRRWSFFALALLIAVTFPARTLCAASVLFDFEPAYLHQPGYTVKDHDLLFDNGLWHAFYIRGIEGVPGTSSELQLGHATSPNLRNWIVLPPVLEAGPDSWDNNRIWAPDVQAEPGGWSMYYTGVAPDFLQRMGIATSTNLMDWTKSLDNPAVEPDSTVYLWSPDLNVPELSAFRDPFQFEYLGQKHLLHTALIPDASLAAGRRGVIHHLVDDGNGGWNDVGPLAVNNNTALGAWRELESVQLVEAESRWHLFFTYFGLGGIYWVSADSLEADWDVAAAQLIDPGVGAELTPLGNGSWILTRHGADVHAQTHPTHPGQTFFVLRADSLRFNAGPGPPTVIRENSFSERWPERQGLAFVAAPTFGDNFVERGEDPIGSIGNGYLSSLELYDGPFGHYGAPGAELGLTATGSIFSKWFSIAPDDSVMTMYVAGTEDPLCSVRLVERLSEEGEPLQTAALDSALADGRSNFGIRVLDLVPWRGRTVRLEVYDQSDTGWVALDHVRVFSGDPVLTSTPPASSLPRAHLLPNRPNPFNPRTELRFDLERAGDCDLEVFDLRGRRVARLTLGRKGAGEHAVRFAADDLASGTYLVRLVVDGAAVDHGKISLVR